MFYVLKGMAFLSIVLRIYFRYLQMYSGDSRCIRYQDSRWVVEQALHANEGTGSEVSHWFSLCTICDLNLLSQSSARMGKVQDCRILQDSHWILWNTILVTWIWPHLWSVETLNQATKQLSFWGPGWKPLGFLIKAVVKPALWPLQREPKEESCLIMSHLIHILYLFNLFALQASVTPKKIFPDWTPACSSLQSDFALETNANPHIAHKDHTLKIRWRVLECYCFLPTSGHVHCLTLCQSCLAAFSGAINLAKASMPSSDSVGIANSACSIYSAFSRLIASPWRENTWELCTNPASFCWYGRTWAWSKGRALGDSLNLACCQRWQSDHMWSHCIFQISDQSKHWLTTCKILLSRLLVPLPLPNSCPNMLE